MVCPWARPAAIPKSPTAPGSVARPVVPAGDGSLCAPQNHCVPPKAPSRVPKRPSRPVPVGELCRPAPASRPGGSSGCSRRRTRRGGRGRRGAAKALPWCRVPAAVPGEAAPAASGPVLRELLFMLPSPLPRGGGGGRRGMGWIFFCCFSFFFFFLFLFFYFIFL